MQYIKVTYLFLVAIFISLFVPNSFATNRLQELIAQDTILNTKEKSTISIDTTDNSNIIERNFNDSTPIIKGSVKEKNTPSTDEVSNSNMFERNFNDSNIFDRNLNDSTLTIQDSAKEKNITSIDTTDNSNIIERNFNDSTPIIKDSAKEKKDNSIDEIIESSNKDSLILDLKSNKLHLFKEAEIKYLNNTMKADIMEIDTENNNIFAKGSFDSIENKYRKTIFVDQNIEYNLDSIHYNLKTEKGKIYGVSFEDQEGFVHGETIKKVDETMNIKNGKYTTCDLEHPHFYLASTKAQYINDKGTKKIVIGPSYFVLEDVPIPLVIPFGFFPLMTDRTSGLIIPTLGEENLKGFYLRDGGYYQVINDYWDAALTGGIYTLGSWNVRLDSRYSVRYKFSGNVSFDYANDKIEATENAQEMSEIGRAHV